MTTQRLIVSGEENERRLDHVLERLAPDMGLRGRRRLCELGLVTVNGRRVSAAYKTRTGDVVDLSAGTSATAADVSVKPVSNNGAVSLCPAPSCLFPEDKARLVRQTPHLAALYKPAAMHTEALAGKPGSCFQDLLPVLLDGQAEARLLNRLDYPTSGITLAALDAEGERLYREAQDNGLTVKRYLALLEGSLPHAMTATQSLILKNRSRVLVELTDHPDRRRHTHIEPLLVLDAAVVSRQLGLRQHDWTGRVPEIVSLAGCTILKGARHQIRAHCSAMGFPLLGDRRYGALFHPDESEDESFFLHHARLTMPTFNAMILPPWLEVLGDRALKAACDWIEA